MNQSEGAPGAQRSPEAADPEPAAGSGSSRRAYRVTFVATITPAAPLVVRWATGNQQWEGLHSGPEPFEYETVGYAGDNLVLKGEAIRNFGEARVELTILVNDDSKAHKAPEETPGFSGLINYTLPF